MNRSSTLADQLADVRAAAVRCYLMTHGTAGTLTLSACRSTD